MPTRHRRVLLVEPQSLLRSTVVSVAREIELARIEEASSVQAALLRMECMAFDGLLLSCDEDGALGLLTRLRQGELASPADLPVVVMASGCTGEQVLSLKQLAVRRLLLKPFKVRALLESVQQLWAPQAEVSAC
ncbi:MAG: response regulator [Rubrivivax sp.]|jgi:DNA-binding NarL/FixJ family response regulator